MASLDPFSAQIVQLVRSMPDEAILELVRNQLGVEAGGAVAAVAAPAKRAKKTRKVAKKKIAKAAPKKTAKAVRKPKVVRKKRTSAARQNVLNAVERAVKGAKGLSASEVARATSIGQVRVATALRELKQGKRIYQGGDRRFARYAGDPRTAEAASLYARRHAGGPKTSKKRRAKK